MGTDPFLYHQKVYKFYDDSIRITSAFTIRTW